MNQKSVFIKKKTQSILSISPYQSISNALCDEWAVCARTMHRRPGLLLLRFRQAIHQTVEETVSFGRKDGLQIKAIQVFGPSNSTYVPVKGTCFPPFVPNDVDVWGWKYLLSFDPGNGAQFSLTADSIYGNRKEMEDGWIKRGRITTFRFSCISPMRNRRGLLFDHALLCFMQHPVLVLYIEVDFGKPVAIYKITVVRVWHFKWWWWWWVARKCAICVLCI